MPFVFSTCWKFFYFFACFFPCLFFGGDLSYYKQSNLFIRLKTIFGPEDKKILIREQVPNWKKVGFRTAHHEQTMRVHAHASNNNNNNELYLHVHKRELHHCKSILTITKIVTEANRIKIIKHSIINCLAFLNRMIRIALIVVIIHQTHFEKSDWSRAFNRFTIGCELDMINAISAADIAFIMSISTSAWLLSPLECSP